MPKRITQIEKKELARQKLSREWFGEPPTPKSEPLPRWTPGQLRELKDAEKLLSEIIHSRYADIEDVIKFSRQCSHYFENMSARMNYVNKHIPHYQKLTRPAAKEDLWKQIHDRLYGLQTELNLLRRSRERDGTNDQ